MTYKAGICFVMDPPYQNLLDCVQVEAGQTKADDLVVDYGEEDKLSGLWNNTYSFPKDDWSQSWNTEPVGLVNGEYRTEQSAVEICDE